MSSDIYRILNFLIYVPLYVVTFVGIGIILRLRRTHPRACWYAVAAGVVMFLNWGMFALMEWIDSDAIAWARRSGVDTDFIWLSFNAVLSALQTTSAILLIAAIVTGRRSAP